MISLSRRVQPAATRAAGIYRRSLIGLLKHERRPISSSTSLSAAVSPTEGTATAEPTQRQLLILALRSGIPMIGFGFMDNIVMIQAGDLIDNSIGITFGLSTLTAAGFGQCVSDVAGFTSGGIVDAGVSKLNLPQHGLSQAQLGLRSARIYHTAGGCVGVVMGCLLGMCSLFFMDTDKADRVKKAKELDSIFRSIMVDGHKLVRAERCTLWMYDKQNGELWSRVATGTKKGDILRIPSNTGVSGAVVTEGQSINIPDAYKDDRFNPKVDKETGYKTRSILAFPIRSDDGEVIGCIQMINKQNEDLTDGVFDSHDEKMLTMLSSHVNSFKKIVEGK